MRIQNNIMALNTHRVNGINELNLQKSTEKLSSGYRINRAGDDAAGLAISEKMRAQVRGMNRASQNAQDGISLIQAAEGALQETHSILQRIRELAVQGANDINALDDRESINAEINQLGVELDRIASTINFNGKYVLSGYYESDSDTYSSSAWLTPAKWAEEIASFTGLNTGEVSNGGKGGLNLQVGANSLPSDVIQIAFHGVGAKDLLGTEWQDLEEYAERLDPAKTQKGFIPTGGYNQDISDAASDGTTSETWTTGYQQLISAIDGRDTSNGQPILPGAGAYTGIKLVNQLRGQLGAVQNRLEHTVSNLDTVAENLQAAESRIRDVDMAKEMMTFTKNNILNQAATAMLAQANQLPQTVLSLLQ